MRLSDMYLGIASGVFAMYFFPRFSEIRGRAELSAEIRRGLLLIVPAVAVVSLVIYLLRELIVRVVFTSEFLPMSELFGWQMAGNTLKMVGWLLGYVLLAKANPIAMALLETVTLVVWWLLSRFTIARDGVLGAPEAFAITYALYAVATFVGVTLVLRRLEAPSAEATT
jgi:PST family polysaccharide transporter